METELLRLIENYYKKNKRIDKKFIESFIDTVVYGKKLLSYVRKIEYSNEPLEHKGPYTGMAHYVYSSRKIVIFEEAVNKIFNKTKDPESEYTDQEFEYQKYFTIAQYLLHELEHANQLKVLDSNIDNEETVLLKVCFRIMAFSSMDTMQQLINEGYEPEEILDSVRTWIKLCDDNYEYSPAERLAEIRSHYQILKIIEPIKEKIPNVENYEKKCICKNLLRGYGDNVPPTIRFLTNVRSLSELRKLSFYDDNYQNTLNNALNQYSLMERLILGFPITNEEYNIVQNGIDYNEIEQIKRNS